MAGMAGGMEGGSGPLNDPHLDGQTPRQMLTAAALPCDADVDLLLEQAATGRGRDLNATSGNACTAGPRSAN